MNSLTKQRYISTSIWSDDWFDSLSKNERLFYLYLLTNNHTNPAGVYPCTLRDMRTESESSREEIEEMLAKFADAGKAFYYQGYIIIPKWMKHQKLGKRNGLFLGAIKTLKALPDEIKVFISDKNHYDFDVREYIDIPGEEKESATPSNDADSGGATPQDNADSDQNGIQNAHDPDLDLDLDLDPEEFTTSQKTADLKSFPTAKAVDPPEKKMTKNLPRSPPKNKLELTEEQLALFHAAKLCFESSEKSKAILYQDKETTAREMKHLKTLAVRCTNMAPGMSADFLKNILEHFRVMVNGKLKGKAVFTPSSLITSWIWMSVIDSLPENNGEDADMREFIRGMFK